MTKTTAHTYTLDCPASGPCTCAEDGTTTRQIPQTAACTETSSNDLFVACGFTIQ
jgi:hypothetical protein